MECVNDEILVCLSAIDHEYYRIEDVVTCMIYGRPEFIYGNVPVAEKKNQDRVVNLRT